MADAILERFKGLSAEFHKLADDMRLRTARRTVSAGAAVLKKEARIVAQQKGLVRTGALLKNIVTKRERRAPEGTEQYHLGVRHGRELGNGKKVIKYLAIGKSGRVITKRQDDPFYWRFLEVGTRYILARRFLTTALDRKAAAATTAMEARLRKEIGKLQT